MTTTQETPREGDTVEFTMGKMFVRGPIAWVSTYDSSTSFGIEGGEAFDLTDITGLKITNRAVKVGDRLPDHSEYGHLSSGTILVDEQGDVAVVGPRGDGAVAEKVLARAYVTGSQADTQILDSYAMLTPCAMVVVYIPNDETETD